MRWFISDPVALVLLGFGTPLLMTVLFASVTERPMGIVGRIAAWATFLFWNYLWLGMCWNSFERTRELSVEELAWRYGSVGWPLVLIVVPVLREVRRLRDDRRRGF